MNTWRVKTNLTLLPSLSLSSCVCLFLLAASWLLRSPVSFDPGLWLCFCFAHSGYHVTRGGGVAAISTYGSQGSSKHPNPVGKQVASFYGSGTKWQTSFTALFHWPVTWPKLTAREVRRVSLWAQEEKWNGFGEQLPRLDHITPIFSLAPLPLIFTLWPLPSWCNSAKFCYLKLLID